MLHVVGPALAISFADAQGRVLWQDIVDAGWQSISRPRVVLRSGATRLAVGQLHLGLTATRPCGELLIGSEPASMTACQMLDQQVSKLEVSCTTHRIAIFGRLGRTPRAVEAIGRSGRRYAAKVDRRSRAFLVVLPSGEGLRELHVIGPRGYRSPESLPPGKEQCGYEATLFGTFL
jgi:hypothetical protein